MEIHKIFGLVTSLVLLLAFLLVGFSCHCAAVVSFIKHCSRFRSFCTMIEEDILEELRQLHLRLCKSRGTKPNDDLSCLASCPQLSLMLKSMRIDDGAVRFTYRPWHRVEDSEL